jgi:hypothetical protein
MFSGLVVDVAGEIGTCPTTLIYTIKPSLTVSSVS